MKIPKRIKVLAIDIAGIILIILSGLLGWLPGPGGIPLLFGGLGLLAINHEWAANLLHYFKTNGVKILDTIFPNHTVIMAIWDFLVVVGLTLGLYALFGVGGTIFISIGIAMVVGALTAFARNRNRYQIFTKKKHN